MYNSKMHDLIIIGAGPAGLTSSIYASCLGLKHIVIGKILGGQMLLAPDILNYPGFEEISGKELTDKMASQAKKLGGEIIIDSVLKIEKREENKSSTFFSPNPNNKLQSFEKVLDKSFILTTEGGKNYETKTIILATGTEKRKLNIPGETEYTGKGIEYSSACDTFFYEGKSVAIVGGANSAAQAAIQLSEAASKVYLIYRGTELRCDPIKLDQIKNNPKIEILYNQQLKTITGDGQKLTSVELSSDPKTLEVEKLFIEIGGVPGTALLVPLGIELDKGGFIKVDNELATTVRGIFATGDVISSQMSIEQITSAVGLGARATTSVFSFLKEHKAPTLWGKSQITRPS